MDWMTKKSKISGDPANTDISGDPANTDISGDPANTDISGDPANTDISGDPANTDISGDRTVSRQHSCCPANTVISGDAEIPANTFNELKHEFQLYKQKKIDNTPVKIISPKQKEYLITLHQQSDLAEKKFFEAISQLLENPISDWPDLSLKQVSYLINNLLPKHIQTKSKQSLYECRLQKMRTKVLFKTRDIPLVSHLNYEYGYQIKFTDSGEPDSGYRFYYLRFYELAMLDFDNQSWHVIEKKLLQAPQILNPEVRFRIYQTYQGYRIFLVSQPLHYRAKLTFEFLKKMAIDPWYLSFYQHHGFKVRVSPKPDRQEAYIAKYVGDLIIEYQNSEFKLNEIDRDHSRGLDPYLDELLKIHDDYCQKFLIRHLASESSS